MGNHEYCEHCGMSSFHYGEPCDPQTKAAFQLTIRRREELNQKAKDKLKAVADQIRTRMGVDVKLDGCGHALIEWFQFRDGDDA